MQLYNFVSQIVFNNYRDCFPSGPVGHIPAFDADVTDQVIYHILNLLILWRGGKCEGERT